MLQEEELHNAGTMTHRRLAQLQGVWDSGADCHGHCMVAMGGSALLPPYIAVALWPACTRVEGSGSACHSACTVAACNIAPLLGCVLLLAHGVVTLQPACRRTKVGQVIP